MLYYISKIFAKIALGVYFRKIYLANTDVLPKDKPIILAANHPTALIEPVVLGCWLDRPLYYLARGDLYNNNLLFRKLYDWHHMTPIFRREDTGYSNLRSNYATFEKCFEKLLAKKPLMILSEGLTLHEKRLRPMKKGTARIIFGALEKHGDLDIHLVPVGVNYTDSDSFRTVAMFEFGEPIRCTEYTEMYRENPPKAIKKLTEELGKRLKSKVIHIEEKTDDDLVEMFLTLAENDKPDSLLPVSSDDSSLFVKQKSIADAINELPGDEKTELKAKAESYHGKLKKLGISDFGLVNRKSFSFINSMLVVLGALPALLGFLLNILPVWAGNSLAHKIAPSIEFRAVAAIVFSAFIYLFTGIGLYTAGFLMGYGWWTFALVLVPLLGYFFVAYRDFFIKWNAARKVAKCASGTVAELLNERDALKM